MDAPIRQLGLEPIDLFRLVVMQDSIRRQEQIASMVEFVTEGGFWTAEAATEQEQRTGQKVEPIYISLFPDGVQMIHDGHHRIVATYLAGRFQLLPREYVICKWDYRHYNSIYFERGYVTPHHPRYEVRLPDFAAFKREAIALSGTNQEAARKFILENKARYARKRTIWTVEELATTYRSIQ